MDDVIHCSEDNFNSLKRELWIAQRKYELLLDHSQAMSTRIDGSCISKEDLDSKLTTYVEAEFDTVCKGEL